MPKSSKSLTSLLLVLIGCLSPLAAFAQSSISRVGVQFKVSSLGIGGEAGFQILPKANIRAGFNVFNYNHTFDKDGITYDGKLALRSVTANFDWYLAGPLHVGPGVLFYNGFHVNALAAIPGGSTFTLGGTTYESSSATPLNGTLDVAVNKAAPELVIGIGNPVPRNGKHFTMNLDFGVVFQGSPDSTLALNGFACLPPNSSGPTCVNAASNAAVQANIKSQQDKLNDDLSAFRYYPLLSFGIGYRF